MRKTLISLLLLSILACGVLPTSIIEEPAEAETTNAIWGPTECPFGYPEDEHDIECGDLFVFENRNNPESRVITIAVAILHSPNPNKAPDPLVYLDGGPGGTGLYWADAWVNSPILEQRDIILIDQRGTGYSSPQLDCPEEADLDRCISRAEHDEIDFNGYTSAQSAADLNDLRLVLGIEEWNILGVSYGTRLAMTYMRDGYSGIRSVILDSVYPPEVNAYNEYAIDTFRSIDAVLEGCTVDPKCGEAYGNIDERFYTLAADLETNPITFTAKDPYDSSETEFDLYGYDLIYTIFEILYETPSIPYVPKLVWEIENGEYDLIGKWYLDYPLGKAVYGDYAPGFSFPDEEIIDDSELLFYVMECYDEVAFANEDDAYNATSGYDQILRDSLHEDVTYMMDICYDLDLDPTDPIEDDPVISDIPVLILAGQFDPVTPPRWADVAAASLTNATVAVFPGMGHAVFDADDCPHTISQAFLNTPNTPPDLACINEMQTQWSLP